MRFRPDSSCYVRSLCVVSLAVAASCSTDKPSLASADAAVDAAPDGARTSPDGGPSVDAPCDAASSVYSLDQAVVLPGVNTGPRDVFIDAARNVYLAGGTSGPAFPVTNGSFMGGPNGRGDILVMKITAAGVLAWATVIGTASDGDEYAYGIDVAASGDVYVAGRAAAGLPTTAGALTPTYQGVIQGSHGEADAFIAQLDPTGAVVALTYFAGSATIRDIAIDPGTGDLLIASQFSPNDGQAPLPAAWLTGAPQPGPGGNNDGVVARVSSDLRTVRWATYVGGSGDETGGGSIKLDAAGNVYYATATNSADLPVTQGAYQRTYGGNGDLLAAKFTPAGTLVYLTYYGGSGNEDTETHNLGVDAAGNAYLLAQTQSADCPVTAGAFQPAHAGVATDTDYVIAKLSPDGSSLLAATYLGGSGWEGVGSITADAQYVYVSGASDAGYPVTTGAFRSTASGGRDQVLSVLTSDLRGLLYSTYFGGSSDVARADAIDVNGSGDVALRIEDGSTDVPIAASPWSAAGPGAGFVRMSAVRAGCGP